MQMESWIVYAVVVAVWLALPGRSTLGVAIYARSRGRLTALATAPGFALAQVALALAATYVALAATLASPLVLTALQWFTGTLFVLGLVTRAVVPEFAAPLADNDNLRERQAPRIFLDTFAQGFFDKRAIVFYLAIAAQIINPASFAPAFLVWLSVATALPALAVAAFAALASETSLKRMQRHGFRRPRKQPGGIVSIASGAVTAGYRKIAA